MTKNRRFISNILFRWIGFSFALVAGGCVSESQTPAVEDATGAHQQYATLTSYPNIDLATQSFSNTNAWGNYTVSHDPTSNYGSTPLGVIQKVRIRTLITNPSATVTVKLYSDSSASTLVGTATASNRTALGSNVHEYTMDSTLTVTAGTQMLALYGGGLVYANSQSGYTNKYVSGNGNPTTPNTNTLTAIQFFIDVPTCGDNEVDAGEGCDDGDLDNNDGCSSTCTVETGWSCSGDPSTCTIVCGDGLITGSEGCDDSDTDNSDGCSSTCAIESGWSCTGEPSACSVVCGDGIILGAETCDDNNTTAGDGCSATCLLESQWLCSGVPTTCIADQDNDRVPDTIECPNGTDDCFDTDNDGTDDHLDDDDDGDGTDTDEEDVDADGNPADDDSDSDGIPDYLDVAEDGSSAGDSDGDTIADDTECDNGVPCPDNDGDGVPDYMDTDSNGNGVPDSVAGIGDVDGDGIPNYIDDDNDGDGTLDVDEDADDDGDPTNDDDDGDGIPNFLDADDDTPVDDDDDDSPSDDTSGVGGDGSGDDDSETPADPSPKAGGSGGGGCTGVSGSLWYLMLCGLGYRRFRRCWP